MQFSDIKNRAVAFCAVNKQLATAFIYTVNSTIGGESFYKENEKNCNINDMLEL